jgi:hypothetical protein
VGRERLVSRPLQACPPRHRLNAPGPVMGGVRPLPHLRRARPPAAGAPRR